MCTRGRRFRKIFNARYVASLALIKNMLVEN